MITTLLSWLFVLTLGAINSMTTAQLNALLKVVVGCYRAGYQDERNDQQNKKGA